MAEVKDKKYMLERVNSLLLHPIRKQNKAKNLTPENRNKLEKFKDIHKGKRCFIVGGAPSLKQLDLRNLNNEIVFTVNKGYKLRELGLERSTYHLIMDRLLLEDEGVLAEIPADFMDLLFLNGEIDFSRDDINRVFVEILNSNSSIFQEDITKPLMTTATVISQAIQIAYYMGFSEIYLIGVDLDFSKNPGHFYQCSKSEQERQVIYSIKGEDLMIKGMAVMAEFLESKGIKFYNASPAGAVDCVKRVVFKDLF